MAREITYRENMVGNFRLGLFATGSYMCLCRKCGLQYIGDKRSMWCLKCAIDTMEENSNSSPSGQLTQGKTPPSASPDGEIDPINQEILDMGRRQKEFFHQGLIDRGLI